MPLMTLIYISLLCDHPWPNQIFLTHSLYCRVALQIHSVMSELFNTERVSQLPLELKALCHSFQFSSTYELKTSALGMDL